MYFFFLITDNIIRMIYDIMICPNYTQHSSDKQFVKQWQITAIQKNTALPTKLTIL